MNRGSPKFLQVFIQMQTWTILFLETSLVGVALVYLDIVYHDKDSIPNLLSTTNFPFFGFLMIAVGVYSMIQMFWRINMIVIVSNAVLWMYIAATCTMDVLDPTTPIYGFTLIMTIISLMICLRILAASYLLDTRFLRSKKTK